MRMKARILAASLGTLLVLPGCKGQPAAPAAPAGGAEEGFRVAGVGLATPESVLHDPTSDVYLVSNINGNPTAVDGNGFISRLSPDGKVLALKWIDGAKEGVTLNAPKGSAIVGDVLYVADISAVRKFDRTTGAPLGAIEVPGATFLNDMCPGPDGSVIVSDSGMAMAGGGVHDTGSAAVWKITGEGTLTALAKGAELHRPNGVLETPERGLVVVPFGGATVMTIGDGGAIGKLVALPGGSLDGVVRTNDGRLLVSSWETSSVYAIDAAGHVSTVFTDLPAPADIGYDASRNRLLVPLFNDNAVVVKPLS
jgi:hypothetical protein